MVENLLSITRLDGKNVKLLKTSTVLDEFVDAALIKFHKRYPEQEVTVNLPDEFITIEMDALLVEHNNTEDLPSDSRRSNAGIGLRVCSAIIRAHGGTIEAANLKSKGAVFRFALNTEEEAHE